MQRAERRRAPSHARNTAVAAELGAMRLFLYDDFFTLLGAVVVSVLAFLPIWLVLEMGLGVPEWLSVPLGLAITAGLVELAARRMPSEAESGLRVADRPS